jgi:hypothetical protein
MKKRVVIAGSRDFNDYKLFSSVVDKCLSRIRHEYDIIILSGHCSGADMMAERYAQENGFELEIFPADWSLGRKAGPLRNKQMVDIADYAIAFPSGGRGTQSLINFAKQKGIPTKIYPVTIER